MQKEQQLTFTEHQRKLLGNRYVYAVVSRRAQGLSIGINLNPDKTCNFDCPYCQVDRTQKGGERNIDLVILERELTHLFSLIQSEQLWGIKPFSTADEKYRNVVDISFSGDGEPTACPQFVEAMRLVVNIKNKFKLAQVALNLFSNATLFQRERVRLGLEQLWNADGRIWAKLDAGTNEWYKRVDQSVVPFQRILENIAWAGKQRPIVLQAMFHRFGDEEPSEQEIMAWTQRIEAFVAQGAKIAWVQIYTVARKPSNPDVKALSREKLEYIAAQLRGAIAICSPMTRITVSG